VTEVRNPNLVWVVQCLSNLTEISKISEWRRLRNIQDSAKHSVNNRGVVRLDRPVEPVEQLAPQRGPPPQS